MMIGVNSFCLVSIQDGGQHSRLLRLELLAGHVPGVARVDLLPEGGSLCHDLLDDVIAVHLHRRVVLLRGHLRLAHCGEAVVLLTWQPPCLLQNLKIFLCLFSHILTFDIFADRLRLALFVLARVKHSHDNHFTFHLTVMTYHLGVGLRLVVCLVLGLSLGEGGVHTRHDHLPPLHHQGQLVPRLPDKVLGLLVTQIEHILPVDLDQVVARLATRVTSDAIKRYLITDKLSLASVLVCLEHVTFSSWKGRPLSFPPWSLKPQGWLVASLARLTVMKPCLPGSPSRSSSVPVLTTSWTGISIESIMVCL